MYIVLGILGRSDQTGFAMLASFMGTLMVAMGSQLEAKEEEQEPQKTTKAKKSKDVAKAMEKALYVYEQVAAGSMQSLNQMALACFHLAEKTEDVQEQVSRYEKAALTFDKAAKAGCAEAQYNAGLTFNKLGDLYKRTDLAQANQAYETSATYYRQSVASNKEHPDLALKAAINLAIMMLNGDIPVVTEEMSKWVELAHSLAQQYPKKVKALMDTVMAIFIKIESKDEASKEKDKTQTTTISEGASTEHKSIAA